MFRLKTVEPKEATGLVAEVYGSLPQGMDVPGPMLMMSASPEILRRQAAFAGYFRGHPVLSRKFLTLVRYIASADAGFSFCIGFNGDLLKSVGLNDVDLEAIQDDPSLAPLDEREKALLLLVAKTLRKPDELSDADIQAVRDLGYQDSDIFDAMWQGASMRGPAVLFNALAKAC